MFSKEEAAQLRKDFWVSFGKSFPRKWLLYRTKIKGFEFKFDAGRKHLMVALDIDGPDQTKNELLYEQMLSLKNLLTEAIPEIIYDSDYVTESGKVIQRIYVAYPEKFSIYNKNSWSGAYQFMLANMEAFELFFYEYQDYIEQANI